MLCIAGLVGTTCGVVATAYEVVMDRLIDGVWKELGPSVMGPIAQGAGTEWLWIPIVCTSLGALTGALIRQLGEPLANLPGTVLSIHRDGRLPYDEAPSMALISIASIVAAGSLGSEVREAS